MSRAAKAQHVGDFLDLEDEFHLHVPGSAALRLVEDLIRRLRGITRLALIERTLTEADMAEVVGRYERQIDALEERNAEEAERLVVDHLISAAEMIEAAAS